MVQNKISSMRPVGDRIQDLEKNVESNFEPHNFSKKMCESIESQTDIQKAIKKLIKESLAEDVLTQDAVRKIIGKYVIYQIGAFIMVLSVSALLYWLKTLLF